MLVFCGFLGAPSADCPKKISWDDDDDGGGGGGVDIAFAALIEVVGAVLGLVMGVGLLVVGAGIGGIRKVV